MAPSKPEAVSRAGAQGVAQFMPGTARLRGLDALSIRSKRLPNLLRCGVTSAWNLEISALRQPPTTPDLGGFDWLGGRRTLPGETQAYVRLVTGHSAEEWAAGQKNLVEMSVATGVACSPGSATLDQPIPRASPLSRDVV